jgi:hypothetical protein
MSDKESNAAENNDINDETQPGPAWIIPEDGICDAYSDWTHVNWLPLNVRIRFAQIKSDPRTSPAKGTWVVEECAAVTMPWQTVKTLNDLLTKIVTAYEKANGPIMVPEQAIVE